MSLLYSIYHGSPAAPLLHRACSSNKSIYCFIMNDVALSGQSAHCSYCTAEATAQTPDTELMFTPSIMYIHGQVDGTYGGTAMSSLHCTECRSRRWMLIQLYSSCSLVPVATVFALEQKSCIMSPTIKDLCQAREWEEPVTKSHQQYFKEKLVLIMA